MDRGERLAREPGQQNEVASLAARLEMHLAILKQSPDPQYAKVKRELEQALSEIRSGLWFFD
jgi:hypothetical protein